MANGFKAVLFDLDGTLRENRPQSAQVFLDYAVELGLLDSAKRRRQAIRWTHFYWAQSPELFEDLEVYRGQAEAFWTNYARRKLTAYGCVPAQAEELAPQIQAYMQHVHQPEDWVAPDVPQTLARLKEAGFRLGVLSNRTDPCKDYLEELGLIGYLDLALVAGEVACWKPEPAIFHHALQRLGTAAQETVYVGDNYYADVLGSQQAGLLPVLIDPEGLFPEADCPVIRTMGELPEVLEL